VELADEPAAALALLQLLAAEAPVGAVLVDHHLPSGGLAFVRAVQALRLPRAPRLVLMTPLNQLLDEEQRVAARVDSWLSKPVRRDQLRAVLGPAFGLPAEPGAAALRPEPAAAGPAAAVTGLAVLLAEDNRVNRQVALGMLERLGCRVQAVGNGADAVTLAGRNHVDLVLMDCQMPGMDGYAAARALRERFPAAQLPIVALTADAMEGTRERCLAAGMDDYLTKPLRLEQLQAALTRWARPGRVPASSSPVVAGAPAAADRPVPAVPAETLEALLDAEALAALRDAAPEDEPDFHLQLIAEFLNEGRDRLAALHAAHGLGDTQVLLRQAHSLKGAALSVGANALAAHARELEAAAGNREFERIQGTLDSLGHGLVRLNRAFAAAQPVPAAT
jgi:two-component system, sensor histidine kinase and response regulator